MGNYFFEADDPLNDVTLVVEEQHIFFNRSLLMMSSPVFARMFTSDFREKTEPTIPLPGKKLLEMMLFLEQLHPVFDERWKPKLHIFEHLEQQLKLADEYDVKHVRQHCVHLMEDRLEVMLRRRRQRDQIPLAVRCLCLAQHYRLTELRQPIISLAARFDLSDLERYVDFKHLDDGLKYEVAKKRCCILQQPPEIGLAAVFFEA
ncbi:hypothetical protein ACOMHN_022850 [Nucella lapillus]